VVDDGESELRCEVVHEKLVPESNDGEVGGPRLGVREGERSGCVAGMPWEYCGK